MSVYCTVECDCFEKQLLCQTNMAGSKFQYDESGGTFFYFLLAFLVIVVVPCTYYFWPKDPKKGIVIIELNLFTNLPKIQSVISC